MNVTTEHIEQLRAFARIERDAILEREGRNGEDPLLTLIDIPSVDEFVVRELENEMLEERGQLAEFAMARLAGRGTADDAPAHRTNADQLEFALLREIAESCPDLTIAVWQVAGRLQGGASD
ncbi:hypothetical protein [Leucobacter sp. W1478]|uniref:hypothetical protein n=1 Tax=Leucobacter sp. W1478 TaxID=3439065 RepID=UPI003F2FECEE